MAWLQSIDTALFRFLNQSLVNPVFDWLMPKLAGHSMFVPLLIVVGVILLWQGGRRGRVFVLFLAVVVILGDTFVCKTLKEAVGRTRPCIALEDARVLIGKTDSGAMPSSHAANWFAGAMVAFIFYRRSWRFMVPAAGTVAFSRVYDGVHYPGDILAGAILGAGYAAATVWTADALWRWAGRRWWPSWWAKFPSLMFPDQNEAPAPAPQNVELGTLNFELNRHWLRLGYVLIAAVLLFRLGYIASGKIDLSKDEAYQWLWSKHLALSYYSKPPMIAWTQWLGTHLWGDTELGVRFFSPVAAALMSLLLLRFFAREVNARTGFLLVLATVVTPLLALGSTLMTVDPLLVLFWIAAMVAGWRAAQPDGTTQHWLWVGLWTGLSFLSKYTALFLWLSWAWFFLLWRPARAHLRRPGPWLAVLVNAACAIPVFVWNAQHSWITVSHVAENAQVEQGWQLNLGHLLEFLAVTGGLLHPFFFLAAVWAAVAFWKKMRGQALPLYFFCMGAPVYVIYLLFTLHSRVLPNWIAAAVLPLFCLMAVYWEGRWQAGARAVKRWLVAAVIVGLVVEAVAFYPELTRKIAGYRLPPRKDPLRRVQGWRVLADTVEAERRKLAAEGKPAFIICDHYGLTGQITFYLPEARAALKTALPLVYYQTTAQPDNQLWFWPEYRYRETRRGQNAVYVMENDEPRPPGGSITKEFESVTSLGLFELKHREQVTRSIEIFVCRNLR
ncbi:MAG: glycosyltransferase family 39 protein [Verrucomicrobia bacterium]|nr:glycosyltransferase family 39 protein [Verrucomicrobiota bacterium]